MTMSLDHANLIHENNFLKEENIRLRKSILNQCGDNLCHIKSIEELCQAKALPESEFLESCRRYRNQIANEHGELKVGQMTIAQLESKIVELENVLSVSVTLKEYLKCHQE